MKYDKEEIKFGHLKPYIFKINPWKQMKEESKYYTPEIEEFHVGFECEKGEVVYPDHYWLTHTIAEGEELPTEGSLSHYRVKHLDREDIESLGFEHYHGTEYRKGKWHIEKYDDVRWCIETVIEGRSIQYFVGYIKNKSELKRILKQIGV